MKIQSTAIQGVSVVETKQIADGRGRFSRLFCNQELAYLLGDRNIVQMNHSLTSQEGSVRGLHYQFPPYAEMKFVRCLKGSVWDVAVDLRAGSPTFLSWHAEVLSEGNSRMMVIPEGCAHGFQVLNEDSELLYLHTAAYAPDVEGGVRYDDPLISVAWPLAIADVSSRDQQLQLLRSDFKGMKL